MVRDVIPGRTNVADCCYAAADAGRGVFLCGVAGKRVALTPKQKAPPKRGFSNQ